jgi:dihydrolipoamide dehydrogenase
LGHAYGALGTDVHFLVRSKLLRREDNQIADEFQRIFSQIYNVHIGCVPVKVSHANGVFSVTYRDGRGIQSTMTADALLVATGITPNTDRLGLENTRIQLKPNGCIKVNEYSETAAPDVYALGDCVGNYFYRHSVNFEGEYLMRTIFVEKKREPIIYPPVPHAVFTHPQVAGVGKTEEELKAEGVDYVVGINPYQKSAMGMALRSDGGFVKILLDRNTRRILGAHIVGDEASDMIHLLIAMMYKKATLDDLLGMIYIHPALPEIVRNAARNAQAEFERLESDLLDKPSPGAAAPLKRSG